jgi:probable phosphomutase (TIGR03848 family)
MPIFLLIRHGETNYNKKMQIAGRLPGVHINKKGHQQAQALAEKLASLPIKALYSSPLERALETAEPLAKALKLDVIPTPGLVETDCGDWVGQSIKRLRRLKSWQSVQQHPSMFHYPGGEWIGECQHRMVEVIETLRLQHSPQDVLACFSHADPIKYVLAYYLGLPLDNFQRLTIDTGSVTALWVSDVGSRLIMMNINPSFAWDAFQPPQPHKQGSSPKT